MWGTQPNIPPGNWEESYDSDTEDGKGIQTKSNASEGKRNSEQDKTLSFGEYSLSIDEVYRDIKRLTLSRNPLDLIFKANEIREKFAFFINSLAHFISQSFSSIDDDSFINELYYDSKYHYVWMDLAYSFLRDAHFCNDRFDNATYSKKNEEGVLQEYPIDRQDLLGRYDKHMRREDDFLAIKALVQIIIEIYRDSKGTEKHLRKQSSLYRKELDFTKESIHLACKERTIDARSKIAEIIPHFPYIKESFLPEVDKIFESFNLCEQDRKELHIFIFKEIIDLHYSEIRYIFFDTSLPFIKEDTKKKQEQFLIKHNWLRLKGMQELSITTIGQEKDEEENKIKNQKYFKHILNCKELILELEGSIVSPILLPVILKLVASAMTLDKKEFYKFSYILLFLFANSYENEYIPLSRFLNELEVYINYGNKNRSLEKLKIWFSLVMLFVLFMGLGYFLLPPLVYFPGVILTGTYLKMYFIDDYTFSASIQYNLWMRLWSTLLLVIFGYIWITNIGSYTSYYGNLQKKFEGFGSRIVAEILPPEKLAEGVKQGTASILEWNRK